MSNPVEENPVEEGESDLITKSVPRQGPDIQFDSLMDVLYDGKCIYYFTKNSVCILHSAHIDVHTDFGHRIRVPRVAGFHAYSHFGHDQQIYLRFAKAFAQESLNEAYNRGRQLYVADNLLIALERARHHNHKNT